MSCVSSFLGLPGRHVEGQAGIVSETGMQPTFEEHASRRWNLPPRRSPYLNFRFLNNLKLRGPFQGM
jgi:hypothetical protein